MSEQDADDGLRFYDGVGEVWAQHLQRELKNLRPPKGWLHLLDRSEWQELDQQVAEQAVSEWIGRELARTRLTDLGEIRTRAFIDVGKMPRELSFGVVHSPLRGAGRLFVQVRARRRGTKVQYTALPE